MLNGKHSKLMEPLFKAKSRIGISIGSLLMLSLVSSGLVWGQNTYSTNPPSDDDWPIRTLRKMTLEEKLGQLFQIRVYGDYRSRNAPDFLLVRNEIERYHIGSLDLGARMDGPNLVKGNPVQVADILNELQKDSQVPLLVGSDIERGLASRVAKVPDFPFPMAYGAANDQANVEKSAAIIAEQARAIGVHLAFAPVADINSNPENPIINTRSYGEDPVEVAKLVTAFIRGAHSKKSDGYLMVAAKHFPGEGDADSDPHIRLSVIKADRLHLEQRELLPFRAAIDVHTDAIMLAQAAVPSLEEDRSKIAATSKKIVGGLLRQELSYKGLVLTDALEMGGVSAVYTDPDSSGRVAVDAIKAGVDLLMLPRNIDSAFSSVVAAVRSGEIPESRIDASVLKILWAKHMLNLDRDRLVDLKRVQAVFEDSMSFDFAQEVSDSAITLVRRAGSMLPLHPVSDHDASSQINQKTVVILSTDSRRSPLGRLFEQEIKASDPGVQVFHIYNDNLGSDREEDIQHAVQVANKIVVGAFLTHVTTPQASQEGPSIRVVGFGKIGERVIRDTLASAAARTAVIAFGSPYLITRFPEIQTYICTYSLATTAERSAVKALFGKIDNHARLPVSIPGVALRGSSVSWR